VLLLLLDHVHEMMNYLVTFVHEPQTSEHCQYRLDDVSQVFHI
jgi:hypothetical protein